MSGDGEMNDVPPSGGARLGIELLCLLCELAMLALLVISGWSLGNGGLFGIALAVFYPALAVLIWSVWLAPKSRDRLRDPWRFVVQALLFAATGAATALSGRIVLGAVFAVVAIAAFAAARRTV